MQGLVETGTKASVLSIGYEYYEQEAGVAFLTGWNNLVAEGASEGLSIFIWSGDWGSSSDEGGVLAKQCNSTIGNKISPARSFNNVRVGDNAQPCVAGAGTLNITNLMYNY